MIKNSFKTTVVMHFQALKAHKVGNVDCACVSFYTTSGLTKLSIKALFNYYKCTIKSHKVTSEVILCTHRGQSR